jgi:hypothetical protein
MQGIAMSEISLREALVLLASSAKHRSETARLNDVFDEVENALGMGVKRAAVLETLHTHGFTMTLRSFESALSRLRKRRAGMVRQAKLTTDQTATTTESLPVNDHPLTPQRTIEHGVPVDRQEIRGTLPDDWKTGPLTPEQVRLLTPEQKRQRTEARQRAQFPSIYDKSE